MCKLFTFSLEEDLTAILKAGYEEMKAEMKAHQERMMTIMKADLEEIESESEHQEVPREEAAVETIGTLEDRYAFRHLDVGCRRQPKKRTRGYGGSRKKLATARRRMTRRAVPAPFKGWGHKGPTVEKRRRNGPEWNIDIKNRGLKQQLRLGNKKTLNKRNVDEAPETDHSAGGRQASSCVFRED
jgi:hypothetical protein